MGELDKLRAAPVPDRQLERLRAAASAQEPPARPAVRRPAAQRPRQTAAPRPGGSGLRPLTYDLVRAALDRLDANYDVDDDGSLLGIWDTGFFAFSVLGQDPSANVFQVQGMWDRTVTTDEFAEAAVLANEWNTNTPWPKAYARIGGDGDRVEVYAENTVDFGPGVAPEQIDEAIDNGIGGALAFFESAAEMFPNAYQIGS